MQVFVVVREIVQMTRLNTFIFQNALFLVCFQQIGPFLPLQVANVATVKDWLRSTPKITKICQVLVMQAARGQQHEKKRVKRNKLSVGACEWKSRQRCFRTDHALGSFFFVGEGDEAEQPPVKSCFYQALSWPSIMFFFCREDRVNSVNKSRPYSLPRVRDSGKLLLRETIFRGERVERSPSILDLWSETYCT